MNRTKKHNGLSALFAVLLAIMIAVPAILQSGADAAVNRKRPTKVTLTSAKATSSATVRPINWPSVSCSTVPTILDIPKMPVLAGSLPPTVRVPLLSPGYEKGTIPLMQCTRVDFPDPDGPTIKTFSPGLTVRSISRSVGSDCDRYLKV